MPQQYEVGGTMTRHHQLPMFYASEIAGKVWQWFDSYRGRQLKVYGIYYKALLGQQHTYAETTCTAALETARCSERFIYWSWCWRTRRHVRSLAGFHIGESSAFHHDPSSTASRSLHSPAAARPYHICQRTRGFAEPAPGEKIWLRFDWLGQQPAPHDRRASAQSYPNYSNERKQRCTESSANRTKRSYK